MVYFGLLIGRVLDFHVRHLVMQGFDSKVEYQLDTLLEKDIPDRAFVISDIEKEDDDEF